MAGNVLEYVSPSRAGLIARHTINIFSPEMIGSELLAMGTPTVASVTAGANGVTLHPITMPYPFVVNQLFWVNGTTVNGNSDIGIYNEGGSLLVSAGSTANSGSNARQAVDITDYRLPANSRLWLALGTDSASHQFTRLSLTAPAADYIGIKTMAVGLSGGVLVSTATFAAGSNSCMWCGITGSAVI